MTLPGAHARSRAVRRTGQISAGPSGSCWSTLSSFRRQSSGSCSRKATSREAVVLLRLDIFGELGLVSRRRSAVLD